MKTLFTLSFSLVFTAVLLGQSMWTNVDENAITPSGERRIFPEKYRTLELNVDAMAAVLAQAPERFTLAAENANVILEVPLPDGRAAHFRIEESPVMESPLQEQYADIRCYTGRGIEDKYARIKCDLTPNGFHAMIMSAVTGNIFIDPLSYGDRRYYQSYFRKDFLGKNKAPFVCFVDSEGTAEEEEPVADRAGDCKLRSYQLALACTGEYAQYHGGTVASALAAMNTSMNRVNGVTENDCGVTMVLVGNNSSIIFLNASTDPYSNGNGSAMLGQNQTTCDNIIGSANYDIGHVFSTGGGGVAYLGCVCSSSNKAGGVTGSSDPVGDAFDIDYVAHEMGHQYSGRHTQNNNCNRDNTSSHEPGSASTIMGYAGICDPDVQPHSDAYYSAKGLEQFGSFTTGSGNGCATQVNTSNNLPTANAGADYTIPKSTPYVLTATGSDPNGDPITFCWEQMNTQVGTMPPVSTNSQGPMFRSLDPTPDPQRWMPNLDAVIANSMPTWEVLSSVGRTLSFRVTVRDNGVYGCTAEDNMTLTVSAGAGPFAVTAPNTAVTWNSGTTQTVTWNVTNTNAAPVSCANVKISLSTDGGYTYPTILQASTPNDGSQTITVPAIGSTNCRIKVEAVGNIFYDISNVDFTIVAAFPVDLLFFNARLEGTDAVLDWATGSETNNNRFEVEMMKDGVDGEFKPLGKVPGKGASAVQTNYNYRVPGLETGNYFFRLKQVDLDESVTFSPVRTLFVPNVKDVSVSPNPASSSLLLSNLEGQFNTIIVYDGNGNELKRETLTEGALEYRLDVSQLPKGQLQGILKGEQATKTIRFVKI